MSGAPDDAGELDLGLAPLAVPTKAAPGQPTETTWTKQSAKEPTSRPFCVLCMDETPHINGVPTHSVTRATYKEHGPAGTFNLCYQHKEMRQQLMREQQGK